MRAIIAVKMGITAIVGLRRRHHNSPMEKRHGQLLRGGCGRVLTEERWLPAWRNKDIGISPPPHPRSVVDVGNPEDAFKLAAIPCDGVGLPIGNHSRQSDQGSPDGLAGNLERVSDLEQLAAADARLTAAHHSSGLLPRPAQPGHWLAGLRVLFRVQ